MEKEKEKFTYGKNLNFQDSRIANLETNLKKEKGNKKLISKIVLLFYSGDWAYKSFTITEIMEILSISRMEARHTLHKLVNSGVINKLKAYPVFYEPIKDDELRESVGKLALAYLPKTP